MSRFDRLDPGVDPAYCDPLTPDEDEAWDSPPEPESPTETSTADAPNESE